MEQDLTDYAAREVQLQLGEDDFVLFGFPVYGGRIPETFRKRMKGISGKRTPVALIATYGNREYEDALLEIKNISEENGLLPAKLKMAVGKFYLSSAERIRKEPEMYI